MSVSVVLTAKPLNDARGLVAWISVVHPQPAPVDADKGTSGSKMGKGKKWAMAGGKLSQTLQRYSYSELRTLNPL